MSEIELITKFFSEYAGTISNVDGNFTVMAYVGYGDEYQASDKTLTKALQNFFEAIEGVSE